ncbi:MAG TPA: DMT family transporter [Candidatus Olsenella excrementigallinarum]|uniref:DMT family transporter n=1 Tax=Olsenella timonensis TaxID=1805478 RepID=UPI0009F8D280|nr:DMT family transporter [Olsenella timonensis]HJB48889.1 DMT family transporter [Candidatus Olsenella excrementigallinarum]
MGEKDTERRRIVRRGIVATLVGGTFWGLNGTVSKWLMDTYAIDPLWLVCVRELTACWLFIAAAAMTAKGRGQLSGVLRSPRDLAQIAGVSLAAILFSQIAYLEAIDWTNSATATIMQSLGMVLVLAYVCIKVRRRPRRRELVGVALALVGTYLVATGGNPGQLSLPAEGLAWGLACATAAACLSILPAAPMARWGNFTVNGLAFLFSGALLAAWYRPWEHMPALDGVAVAVLALCVVVGTFGAYALYLQGVKDAGSMRASLLGTIEPVTATIATVVWLATPFSAAEIVGFALIIVMVYLTA